jgi:hypothetical protein
MSKRASRSVTSSLPGVPTPTSAPAAPAPGDAEPRALAERVRLAVDEPTAAVLRTLAAGIEDALAAPLAATERRLAALDHALAAPLAAIERRLAAFEHELMELRQLVADLRAARARGGDGAATTAGVGLGATPWTEGEA